MPWTGCTMADHLVADHAGHDHPVDDLWVVLPHLGAGGAQKVGLLAADHFALSLIHI